MSNSIDISRLGRLISRYTHPRFSVLILCLLSLCPVAFADPYSRRVAEYMEFAAQAPQQAAAKARQQLAAAGKNDPLLVERLITLIGLTSALNYLEQPVELARSADEGIKLAQSLKDSAAHLHFKLSKAHALYLLGLMDEAWETYREALRLAQAQSDPELKAEVYTSYAPVAFMQGYISEAQDYSTRAVQHYQKTPGYRLAASLITMGTLYDRLGEFNNALHYAEQAKKALPPQAFPYQELMADVNLGIAYYKAGKTDLSKQTLESALLSSSQLGADQAGARAHYYLGLMAREEGFAGQALEHVNAARKSFEAVGRKPMQLLATLAIANIYTASQNRQALTELARARELINTLDNESSVRYYEQAANTYAVFNEPRAAYEHLQLAHRKSKEAFRNLTQRGLHEQMAKFDSQRKDAENELLRKEKSLQQAELKQAESEQHRLILLLVLAALLSGVVGYALYVQLQHRTRLSTLALRDELTGVPNRRSILTYAKNQYLKSQTKPSTFCVALLDLDHFKRINDTFGHTTGDHVLRAFAHLCMPVLRGSDKLGRLGGEEFLLVLPQLSKKRVHAVFTRLQAAMRELRVEGLPADYAVTFSMGAVISTTPGRSLEDLLQLADKALYDAKDAGRNCLRIAAGDAEIIHLPRKYAGR